MLDDYKVARNRSVPLIAITTPDQPATTNELLNHQTSEGKAVIRWDSIRGAIGLDKARQGEALLEQEFGADSQLETTGIAKFLEGVYKFSDCVIIMHNIMPWFESPPTIQAVCNLRDQFGLSRSCLVMLGDQFTLPSELAGDTLILDEPLPTQPEMEGIIRNVYDDLRASVPSMPELSKGTIAQGSVALAGLSRFAAVQASFLSSSKSGLSVEGLWSRTIQVINAQDGLTVWRGGEKFADVGGCDNIKGYYERLFNGPGRPNVIAWMDEIEKMMSNGDSVLDGGTTQDQLGHILQWMQNNNIIGVMEVGPPGAAKSAMAKAVGGQYDLLTIQVDLGAAKSSLVGSSERKLRQMTKTIDAVGQGKVMLVATSNRIANLPPELRRRFADTFFFDLPTQMERAKIWQLYTTKFSIDTKQPLPNDHNWTGAEILNCCKKAYWLNCTLVEAAQFIVPVYKSAAKIIANLREEANGNYISASYEGAYDMNRNTAPTSGATLRQVNLD